MLSTAHRLRDAEDFRTTTRHGKRASSRTLVAHLRLPEGASADEPLVGFVVGRNVGSAVVRNAVKRRLRHLVRGRLMLLPAGSALVVRAKPNAAGATSADLGAGLDDVLSRVLDPR
ncbi:ribonuclease P protein component [Solicola gregarius]|uniref:Ribonuclease P protein component n=1 Tax=Solicola gregarius TaxID=2908642 RepID=A0AA46YN92_9ACTN|nr:ribonuclease P protein component [Solicola gregarius]UYM07364.1 ribonuclease P protein component [Solicola gregarius]